MKNLLLILCFFFSYFIATAQNNTMCGNGDFESGVIDPAEWTGTYGTFLGDGNCTTFPVISYTGFSSDIITNNTGNQTIVPNTIEPSLTDPNCGISVIPPFPFGNTKALRLGNQMTCTGFESMEKSFIVDPLSPILRFWYAYVGEYAHSIGGSSTVSPVFNVSIFEGSNDISSLVDLGNGSNNMVANQADPFITVHNNQWVYRDWTCVEVDLSQYINQLVTVRFLNRDCTQSGHAGYTYLDNLCIGCTGSPNGSIEMDYENSDTCGLPGQICINYTLPNAQNVTGDCQLDLTLYQNGAPVIVLSSPVLTSGTQYCFDLNSSNTTGLNTSLGGFDYSVNGNFTITIGGNTTVLPDKTAPDVQDTVQNNDYLFICAGADNCDSLMVMANLISDTRCCYSIDLKNFYGSPITYVEATIANPDWVFANGYTTGGGFTWFSTPDSDNLPIWMTSPVGSNGIPNGNFTNALEYCLESAVANPTLPQVVVFTWYTGAPTDPNGYTAVCTDTIITECIPPTKEECLSFQGQIVCNPENPYEYIANFTITNNSNFNATHLSLDNLSDPVQFGFSKCNQSDHLSAIAIPLSPSPLLPSQTSNVLCVKFTSTLPVLVPTQMSFYIGIYNPEACCHNEMPVTITLQPCCDPCGDISVDENPIEIGGDQCCYSLDIENNCGYEFFTGVVTEIVTPGVSFGYHALGGPFASEWNMGSSSSTHILWEMNGNATIPEGISTDLIQFCLDGIDDPSESPQVILLHWLTKDRFGLDSLACSDTLVFNCPPVIDYNCLEVSNQLLECSLEDSTYCYTFTVKNTSDIPFGATNLDLFEVSGANLEFNGGGGTFPLPPLNSGDTIRLTVCMTPSQFPLADSLLIFQYRLRYLMGDTCCYESQLDTILVPDCIPPDTTHGCCYPSFITLPTGLSPNGDGLNDTYVIKGIDRCEHVNLTIYNRWGNIVYQQADYDNTWGGTNADGEDLPQGTYFVLLSLLDSGVNMSGFIDIRRL